MFALVRAILHGVSLEELHRKTHIDIFFLTKLQNIVTTYLKLKSEISTLDARHLPLLRTAKKRGFSDRQLERILGIEEEKIYEFRKYHHLLPKVNRIDTLAGEFPSETNYCYMTYHGDPEAEKRETPSEKKKVLVLGSGAYRIGSSVEFDWCSVSALSTLRTLGYETIMLNFNPETVSTDFDTSDILYFEEINLETIRAIFDRENPIGVIIAMGGQIANNLATRLKNAHIPVIGTDPDDIDSAENRHAFSSLLDSIDVEQPLWAELTTKEEALLFAEKHEYPVIIRPSYVLSGANMRVCADRRQLEIFLDTLVVSREFPTVISKFEMNAKEIEIDGVAKDGKLELYAISEHIENAGVHS